MYPTPTLACNDGNWKISPHYPSRKAQQELIKKFHLYWYTYLKVYRDLKVEGGP